MTEKRIAGLVKVLRHASAHRRYANDPLIHVLAQAADVIEALAAKADVREYEAVWGVLNNGYGDTNDVLKASRQARLARIK